MRDPTFVLLHGFLGQVSDWDDLKRRLPEIHFLTPSLLDFPTRSFEAWTEGFCDWITDQGFGPLKLIGYSLGGRLAAHAFVHNPALWSDLTLISCRLDPPQDREIRLINDRKWSNSIINLEYKQWITEWNAQNVFCGKPSPFVRKEGLNSQERKLWSEAIVNLSIAKQKDLTPKLRKQSVLWVAGSEDQTYSEKARTQSRYQIFEGAGHRIPWEKPEEFSQFLKIRKTEL